MPNPLGFMSMLGLGLPNQDGNQLTAVQGGVENQVGGGRKRKVSVTGTPGSIALNPQMGALGEGTQAALAQADAPRMPSLLQGQPNTNGLAQIPGGDDADIRALRTGITNRVDPYAQAKADMANRGLGSKIMGGLLGFLENGISGAIYGARGTGREQALIDQYKAANAAQDEQGMKLIKLQDLADERQFKRSADERDRMRIRLEQGRGERERLAHEDLMKREAERLNWEREKAKGDIQERLLGRLGTFLQYGIPIPGELSKLSGVPEGFTAPPKPENRLLGFNVDDRGIASHVTFDAQGNPIRQVIPGFQSYNRPPVGPQINMQMPSDALIGAIATAQISDEDKQAYYKQAEQSLMEDYKRVETATPGKGRMPTQAEIKDFAGYLAQQGMRSPDTQGRIARRTLETWMNLRGQDPRRKIPTINTGTTGTTPTGTGAQTGGRTFGRF